MSRERKAGIWATVLFLLPGLVIPAFIHQPDEMRRWCYFGYLLASPVAAFVACMGKPRSGVFLWGIGALILPMEICWGLAFQASYVHPTKEQIAAFYLPLFFFTTMVMLPVGVALTYKGSRGKEG